MRPSGARDSKVTLTSGTKTSPRHCTTRQTKMRMSRRVGVGCRASTNRSRRDWMLRRMRRLWHRDRDRDQDLVLVLPPRQRFLIAENGVTRRHQRDQSRQGRACYHRRPRRLRCTQTSRPRRNSGHLRLADRPPRSRRTRHQPLPSLRRPLPSLPRRR